MSELRIALIMGGGVSLGSFSSGALAQVLKLLAYAERGPAKIDVVTGASAGSMTLGIVLYHLFRGSTLQEIEHALYDSWVERISFDALHPNLQSHRQPSVFTDESIRSIAKTALSFDSWSSHRHPHPFFAEETVVSFALTNLNGIPVRTEGQLIQQGKAGGGTAGGSDSVFADAVQTTFHDDVIRFVLRRTPPARGNGDLNRYGARTLLPWTTEARTREWEMFREAAIASGAFPVAFPPVRLRRKRNEYRVWDKELGDAQDTEFTFDYLDGGILRNEPLREAIHLAAKRDEGQDVERVFVLIDPNVSGTNELYPLSFNQALALQQHFSDWGDPSSILLDTPTYIAHMLGVLGRFGGVLASQATFRDWLKAARVNSQIEWRKRLTALLDDVDLVAGANAESLMDELLLDIYRDKAVRSPTATLSPEDRAEIEAAIQQDLSRRAEDGRIDFRTKIFLLIDLIGNLRDKQKLNMVAITPASVPGGGTIPIAGNFFNNFGGFFNVEYRQHDFEAGAYVASEVLTAEVPGARAFLQQGAPKAPRPDPVTPIPASGSFPTTSRRNSRTCSEATCAPPCLSSRCRRWSRGS